MKLRSLLFLGLMGAALTACGDDDDGGGSGGSGGGGTGGSSSGGTGGSSTGGSAGTGGTAGSGTGGTAGSGTGGTAGSGTGGSGTGGSGTGGSGTGGSGTGGTGGGGGNMTPEAFCASYETHCGFGATGHYATSAECKTKYAAFNDATKGCTNQHLAMADSKTSVHCTHATGIAPCNL